MIVFVAIYGADRGAAGTSWTGSATTAFAGLFYVANWRFIIAGQSYFDLFTSPSPFRHLWSLAIEEQFYLVWPLVVLGCLKVAPRPAPRARRGLRRRRRRVRHPDGRVLFDERRPVTRVLRHRLARAHAPRRMPARVAPPGVEADVAPRCTVAVQVARRHRRDR